MRRQSHFDIRLPTVPVPAKWTCVRRDYEHYTRLCGSLYRGDYPSLLGLDLLPVVSNAPSAARRAVWQFADYFRREFIMNAAQDSDVGVGDDQKCVAFLWQCRLAGEENRVLGACCFQDRQLDDTPHAWSLQWVWLHPFERRRGHLSRAWPYFAARFGPFYVEPPWTDAMQAFLTKKNHAVALPRRPSGEDLLHEVLL
jgi:hypothetical protein